MYNQSNARAKNYSVLYDWIDEVGIKQRGPSSPNVFKQFLKDLRNYVNEEYGFTIYVVLLHLLLADDRIVASDTEKGLPN